MIWTILSMRKWVEIHISVFIEVRYLSFLDPAFDNDLDQSVGDRNWVKFHLSRPRLNLCLFQIQRPRDESADNLVDQSDSSLPSSPLDWFCLFQIYGREWIGQFRRSKVTEFILVFIDWSLFLFRIHASTKISTLPPIESEWTSVLFSSDYITAFL